MDKFCTIDPKLLHDNPFQLIGSDWMLITAGTPESFNTMTASWGGLGVLWQRNVCFCFIRPTRFTYEFIEKAENFTLSFFDESYRGALTLCGTKSGRDIDKARAANLTPIVGKLDGTTGFAEARLILECKKLYFEDMNSSHFIDPTIENNYPEKDYHRMYVGEIINCFKG